ncbi:2-dehydropantoate 2-reductase [Bacillus sp. DX1.1]|uniref:2-dehydropantoate 2-reductase n=1 Tax=unclassified Bacillus (in: firmicutes) TaxID=185979 RepID=UPI00257095D9|nr:MULTISPECIES: 2-dehydropantoate 2-reductase [unclassified Bacillus (in: firmicutes)]MDM5156105.1 2-dehydropantoate 2-reductase [Bacillus sp. DX1.1]WJE80393.1 2-dehydropantoate 2-reductase [Bacillus sp. DX3.1]
MKIGVVGPGAIGLLFAFYLKKNKQDVTLYTRTIEQAEKLMKVGVTCFRHGKTETVFPDVMPLEKVADDRVDYMFVAVKQYHLEYVLPFIKGQQRLVFLQNGMSHLHLFQKMKHENVAVGIVEHGAKKENDDTVHHTGVGVTKFGLVRGDKAQFESLFHCFSSELFPLQIEEDWKSTMCNKLIVNVCINPLTALFGVQNGELLTNPFFYKVMEQVFQEVIFLVEEEKKEELWQFVCNVCESTSSNISSMLADVKNHRKTEIDAIIGYTIGEAEKQQKQVPILQFLYHSIKGLEV